MAETMTEADGAIDDGFDLGEPCVAGLGACETEGVTVCGADKKNVECGAVAKAPSLEKCNGVDDDCDGAVDDEFGVGDPCAAGTGACLQAGVFVCAASGGAECSATPKAPSPETCDGVDNDCDGAVDDGFELGKACEAGVGACVATGVLECAKDHGGAVCNAVPLAPTTEVCDGVDNDCDGAIDDGLGVGDPCTVGVGACLNAGVRVCAPDGESVCSVEALEATAEKCNGLDDDCDGAVDDGFGLGEPCTIGVGACADVGSVVCKSDGSGTECTAAPAAPSLEACDGVDNDCDGDVDDGFALGEPCVVGVGACEATGETVCSPSGKATECSAEAGEPSGEGCDGVDNDCDGETDEGFGVGEPCWAGVGACESEGVTLCTADAKGIECDAVPLPPAVELCDGIDNDCEGTADNGYSVGTPCTVGLGPCESSGVFVCQQGGAGTVCSVAPLPGGPELCDGVDNDCDGAVDDGFPVGEACAVGAGACESVGVLVCAPAGDGTVCSAAPLPSSPELCDGVDNDCDGAVDNGFGLGDRCTVRTGGCMAQGWTTCAPDGTGTQCTAEPPAGVPELCDGVDNDCDGTPDNGFGLGELCAVGVGGCAAAGVLVCNADQTATECSATPGEPEPEACNGEDDDCDGAVDEDFEGLGAVCHVGQGACESEGTVVCAVDGTGTKCDAQAGAPSDEKCDVVDNDCDGTVDEDCECMPEEERLCGSSVGACEEGLQTCGADGLWGACVGAVDATDEVCDGEDNDCDGETDPACACIIGSEEACGLTGGECQPGQRVCVAGAWGPCQGAIEPADEACDGLDNDCDGLSDELFPELGEICVVGLGACKAEGLVVCAVDGLGVGCSAQPGEPSAETCDGVDDDCDGDVDEDGVCAECEPGAAEACVPPGDGCDTGARVCGTEGSWGACEPDPSCTPVGEDAGPADAAANGSDIGAPEVADEDSHSGKPQPGAADTMIGLDADAGVAGTVGSTDSIDAQTSSPAGSIGEGGCNSVPPHAAGSWLLLASLLVLAALRRKT